MRVDKVLHAVHDDATAWLARARQHMFGCNYAPDIQIRMITEN